MMNKESELKPYFQEFDKLGESDVRMAIYANRWDSNKIAAALVWLEVKDESKQTAATHLNRHIAIAAYIAAIAAVIATIPAIEKIIEFLE